MGVNEECFRRKVAQLRLEDDSNGPELVQASKDSAGALLFPFCTRISCRSRLTTDVL